LQINGEKKKQKYIMIDPEEENVFLFQNKLKIRNDLINKKEVEKLIKYKSKISVRNLYKSMSHIFKCQKVRMILLMNNIMEVILNTQHCSIE
jgi:hypothetical protein